VPAPELSAVILCYRAGENVRRVAAGFHSELTASGVPFELILVANYDDEADPTPAVAAKFAAEHQHVRVLKERKQGAMGWDMRSGLDAATGAFLVAIDGDEQNPFEDVVRAYRLLVDSGVDVVKGRRTSRLDGPLRRLVSTVYNSAFRVMFRTGRLWDINGKPKGLRRSAYERLRLTADDWFVDAEIVLRARDLGMSIAELPVEFRQNRERRSFVDAGTVGEFLKNMARFRIRRSGRPR
jgi:glycosyltransferase involved in cell wall biosynthesis